MKSAAILRHQRGAALLLIFLILVVGVTVWVLEKSFASSDLAVREKSLRALGAARAALLGYAVAHADTHPGRGPGFLPCPDLDGDGYAEPACPTPPGQVALGRLPWRDLSLDRYRDGAGEVLWYALSVNYRESPAVAVLNSDTDLHPFLQVDGTGSEIGAVVLAPGAPFPGQHRPSNRPSDYLEGVNKDPTISGGIKEFRNFADPTSGGNDLVLGLSRDRLWQKTEQRVLHQAATMLQRYYKACGYLPWAAPFDPTASKLIAVKGQQEGLLPLNRASATGSATVDWDSGCASGIIPGWLHSEGWGRLLYYAAATPWLEGGSGRCGPCLVLDGINGKPAILVSAGRDLGAGRPSTNPGDYYEGQNASTGDHHFQTGNLGSGFNDQVMVVQP